MRGAVGMFLLLFFEVRFVGFGCLFWFEVAMLGRDTPPAPLERGVLDTAFCLIIMRRRDTPLGPSREGSFGCWVLFDNWYSAYNHFFLYFVVVIGFCGGRSGQKRGGCLWDLV